MTTSTDTHIHPLVVFVVTTSYHALLCIYALTNVLCLMLAFSNGESATDSGVGTINEESDDPKEEYVIGKSLSHICVHCIRLE